MNGFGHPAVAPESACRDETDPGVYNRVTRLQCALRHVKELATELTDSLSARAPDLFQGEFELIAQDVRLRPPEDNGRL